VVLGLAFFTEASARLAQYSQGLPSLLSSIVIDEA